LSILGVFGEEYKLWTSPLLLTNKYSPQHFFPNTLNLCSSLRVAEHKFIWLNYSFTGVQDSDLSPFSECGLPSYHNVQFSRWLEYFGGTYCLHLHLTWTRRQQVLLKLW
jgi:hypothetical protein